MIQCSFYEVILVFTDSQALCKWHDVSNRRLKGLWLIIIITFLITLYVIHWSEEWNGLFPVYDWIIYTWRTFFMKIYFEFLEFRVTFTYTSSDTANVCKSFMAQLIVICYLLSNILQYYNNNSASTTLSPLKMPNVKKRQKILIYSKCIQLRFLV